MAIGSDRAVTPIIGVVLLAGIFFMGIAVWQVNVVPVENAEHEFDQYQVAVDDLTDLRNALVGAGSRGTTIGTSVRIGLRYPQRTILQNPGPISGELRTDTTRSVTFENISAVESEAKNTRRIWTDKRRYTDETTGIVFDAPYNYHSSDELPEVVVTGETVIGARNSQLISHTKQTLIKDNRIRLTFIRGQLSATGQDTSVIAEPESTSLRTVTLTGNDSGTPTLRLDPPPETTATAWINEYGNLETTNEWVNETEAVDGKIVLKLNASRTFQLQIASVVVGSDPTNPTPLGPEYIIKAGGGDQVVNSGKNTTVVAEVRDRFNNPVTEADVTFEITNGDARFRNENNELVTGTRTLATDGQGQARQTLKVESVSDDVKVEASVDGVSGQVGTATFLIETPEESNPVELAGVRFEGAKKSGGRIDVTFENVIEDDRAMKRFRMDFYQGGSPSQGTIEGQSFTVGGSAIDLNPQLTIPAGTTQTFSIQFDSYTPTSGDWFIITITYDTGDTAQYFGAT